MFMGDGLRQWKGVPTIRGALSPSRAPYWEDVCKWILDEAEVDYPDNADLPVLYRKLAKVSSFGARRPYGTDFQAASRQLSADR
jgi:hypothetical protein